MNFKLILLVVAGLFISVPTIPDPDIVLTEPIKAVEIDQRLIKLNKFFDEYHCPQPNYAEHYIAAADKNGVDWRLLPAISIIESSCGKHSQYQNFWGWNSARSGFRTVDEGIDFVYGQLGSGRFYRGLTVRQKLGRFNPNPSYPQKVINIMLQIDAENSSNFSGKR